MREARNLTQPSAGGSGPHQALLPDHQPGLEFVWRHAASMQEAATREITRNVLQASEGTKAVADNVESLRRIVETKRGASAELLNSSAGLSRETKSLRQSTDEVIARLRG